MSGKLLLRIVAFIGIAAVVGSTFLATTTWARRSSSAPHSQNASSVEGGQVTGSIGSSNAQSPRDAATGQATGKRQHKPVQIIKEWGTSSPN